MGLRQDLENAAERLDQASRSLYYMSGGYELLEQDKQFAEAIRFAATYFPDDLHAPIDRPLMIGMDPRELNDIVDTAWKLESTNESMPWDSLNASEKRVIAYVAARVRPVEPIPSKYATEEALNQGARDAEALEKAGIEDVLPWNFPICVTLPNGKPAMLQALWESTPETTFDVDNLPGADHVKVDSLGTAEMRVHVGDDGIAREIPETKNGFASAREELEDAMNVLGKSRDARAPTGKKVKEEEVSLLRLALDRTVYALEQILEELGKPPADFNKLVEELAALEELSIPSFITHDVPEEDPVINLYFQTPIKPGEVKVSWDLDNLTFRLEEEPNAFEGLETILDQPLGDIKTAKTDDEAPDLVSISTRDDLNELLSKVAASAYRQGMPQDDVVRLVQREGLNFLAEEIDRLRYTQKRVDSNEPKVTWHTVELKTPIGDFVGRSEQEQIYEKMLAEGDPRVTPPRRKGEALVDVTKLMQRVGDAAIRAYERVKDGSIVPFNVILADELEPIEESLSIHETHLEWARRYREVVRDLTDPFPTLSLGELRSLLGLFSQQPKLNERLVETRQQIRDEIHRRVHS